MTEKEIVAGLQAEPNEEEERRLLEQLFDLLYPWVSQLCSLELVSVGGAEDCAQESLMEIARGLRSFRGDSSFKTWAYTVTKRRIYKFRSKRKRESEGQSQTYGVDEVLSDDSESLEETILKRERKKRLLDAIARLPEMQRHSVTLYYLEDKSLAMISEIIGAKEGTIKSHLSRARKTLRKVLGEEPE